MFLFRASIVNELGSSHQIQLKEKAQVKCVEVL